MVVLMKSASSTALIILCMAMAAYEQAEAAISCASVSNTLSPCIPYAKAGKSSKPPAACCSGIKTLNNAAKTTPDRQAVCNCLKSIARAYPSDIVEGLPGKCGVRIPYKIRPSTDCKRVK